MRTIYRTPEFDKFLFEADSVLLKKVQYITEILLTQKTINSKVAKKLTNTILYEIRIQIANEYRIFNFAMDHEDISQANNIVFISCFMKKSTKDYQKEISKALKILERWIE